MSNNTRQPTGHSAGSSSAADDGDSSYRWTADSDWLRPPSIDGPEAGVQPLVAADSRAVSAMEGRPGGWDDVDPHEHDRTMVVPPVEELFASERADAYFDEPRFEDDDHDDYHDYGDLGFRTSPLERIQRHLSWWVLAVVVAVVAAALVAMFALRSDDGDGSDLTAIGGSSSATTSTTASRQRLADDDSVRVEPGADTVRTGPGIPTASGDADTLRPDPADPADPDDPADPPASDTEGTPQNGPEVAAGGEPAADGDPAVGSPATGGPAPSGSTSAPQVSGDYASNLALIRGQSIRNRNEDDSPHRQTPSDQLVPENHYGPRSDYLKVVDGNIEPSFPVPYGGQFRVACEFSHFAYDDPLVYPNQPGASHLHMFFGNTDTNAFSTADSIKNSGGATCNGSELNRTGYWVPAMFDGKGNVRIPERVVVYYKGEGLAKGKAEVFPEGAAMIASVDLNTVAPAQGGAAGKFSYNCSNNYSGFDDKLSNTMPNCVGTSTPAGDMYTVLEVNVKFPQCWNGQDPGNPANFRHPTRAGWYGSLCDGAYNRTLVNLEYFVNYRVEAGETTQGWFLSSDVSPTERVLAQTPGSTNHGDWWSGWHTATNKMFIDNCVNFSTNAPSGCGFGYLTNGGPDNNNPLPGPALALRDQYLGPQKVAAAEVYAELCPNGGALSSPTAAAFCTPATALSNTSAPGSAPPAHSPNALFCPVHRGMLASDPASPLSGGGLS